MGGLQVDLGLLREFERGLDPRFSERSKVPARVLGYGEISTVFAIQVEEARDLAFKRLPIFCTADEAEGYQAAYEEYNRLLEEEIGLNMPPHGCAAFLSDTGRPIIYIIHGLLTICANHDQSVNQFLPPLTIQEDEVRQVLVMLDRMITWVEGVLRPGMGRTLQRRKGLFWSPSAITSRLGSASPG
jgi:hypothetical protein